MASTNPKYQVRDWQQHNSRLIHTSRGNRTDSNTVRDVATAEMRNAQYDLQKTQREVQNQLTLRIDDIAAREADLAKSMEDTFKEIGKLENHMDTVRSANQAKDLPLEIAKQCSEWRKSRLTIDNVKDDVERQLIKEESVLNQIKATLARREADCVEQLRLLRSAHHQLDVDKQDKNTALGLDKSCSDMLTTTRGLNNFSSATRIDPNSVHPPDWDNFTDDNIGKASREQKTSEMLREAIDGYLKASADSLNAQSNATDDAFNTRISETSAAKDLDESNLAKTRSELAEQAQNIANLEAMIQAQDGPLKMAETRLTTRARRPNVELVHDHAQDRLISEVNQINNVIESLNLQKVEAESAHRALVRAENSLLEDIAVKTNSLEIDNRCMSRRQQFKYRSPSK